jgi:hypothetical protein
MASEMFSKGDTSKEMFALARDLGMEAITAARAEGLPSYRHGPVSFPLSSTLRDARWVRGDAYTMRDHEWEQEEVAAAAVADAAVHRPWGRRASIRPILAWTRNDDGKFTVSGPRAPQRPGDGYEPDADDY